jgi:AcrR family transcriptional regulator
MPPDERRSMIVAAAAPLVLEHGADVTTRQVADAVGIAEGTLFRAFADKQELLQAVIDAALDPGPLEEALGAIDPGLPLLDLVAAAADVVQQRVTRLSRLITRVGPHVHGGRPRPMAQSAALARLLEPHRDQLAAGPEVSARRLQAVTFALSHPLLADEPAPPREIAAVFLHGMAARPEGAAC